MSILTIPSWGNRVVQIYTYVLAWLVRRIRRVRKKKDKHLSITEITEGARFCCVSYVYEVHVVPRSDRNSAVEEGLSIPCLLYKTEMHLGEMG